MMVGSRHARKSGNTGGSGATHCRRSDELPQVALEGLALEGIRTERLTVSQARRLLNISSRYQMDGFLKAHGVFLDLTLEDIRKDSNAARSLAT